MKNYHELYQDRYTGGAIKTYTFVNNTLTAETNEQKEYEIRMLKYARMILISGYAVSLVATTLGSFLMLILRRLRNLVSSLATPEVANLHRKLDKMLTF